MANTVDLYSPRTLAEVVRTAPQLHTFLRDTFFTNVQTFATERVDIDIVKGDRRMAAFVHPRVGGKVLKGTGYSTKSYKPPLIDPYDITTADQLLQRLPGETVYSGRTPAQRAAEKLVQEYNRLNDAVTRREEWMCAQALVTGQIPVVGDGVDELIDFGLTNKVELTGTAQWGKSAADIIGNLHDWKQQVSVNGFVNVDTVILGKKAAAALMDDSKIMDKLDNRRYEFGGIAPQDDPANGTMYYGHLNYPGLDLIGYNEVYLDDWTDTANPTVKPLIPDNAVILASRSAAYMRAYGLCTYLDDAGNWITAETDRLLRSYAEHRPDRRFLEIQTHPLPIPDKADSWLVATVL